MGRDSDTRRTNGRYQEHVEFGIDLLRPHVLDPMMAMTVRVVSFDVNIVSSMLKSREESILFSMKSLSTVSKVTPTTAYHGFSHSLDALRSAWYEHRVATKVARVPYKRQLC